MAQNLKNIKANALSTSITSITATGNSTLNNVTLTGNIIPNLSNTYSFIVPAGVTSVSVVAIGGGGGGLGGGSGTSGGTATTDSNFGGSYGGGGGGSKRGSSTPSTTTIYSGNGGGGGVRIMWAGTRSGDVSRAYPSTNTGNL